MMCMSILGMLEKMIIETDVSAKAAIPQTDYEMTLTYQEKATSRSNIDV